MFGKQQKVEVLEAIGDILDQSEKKLVELVKRLVLYLSLK